MSNEPTTPTPVLKPQDDTIKETFESIVIAFILAFVFRAYVVEAFVIPTGSMAPTLLGEHMRVNCDQCGYHFKVETPSPPDKTFGVPADGRKILADITYRCPMCRHDQLMPKLSQISSGDRILVHKYLYSINEPQRWDVVVFKAPHKPQINYIKRLIGLPSQDTMILEGNIYYNASPGDESKWQIARKTDPQENRHAEKVQRVAWQPIHHTQYVPLDFPTVDRWRSPWVIESPKDATASAWKRIDESSSELDPRGGIEFKTADASAMRFAFPRVYDGRTAGFFPYGQGFNDQMRAPMVPVEDVRIAAAIEAKQAGFEVNLQTTARLDDKTGTTHALTLTIDAAGNATLSRSDVPTPIETVNIGAFEPGITRLVEFWYVDQEASLWIDGKRVLVKQFDDIQYVDLMKRPMAFVKFENAMMAQQHEMRDDNGRQSNLSVPVVKVNFKGSPVTFHRIELDRDLYYTATGDMYRPGKGVIIKNEDASTLFGEPAHLKADEFFCLGDNSPFSSDGRAWVTVDPWVLARSFADGTSEEHSHGIVPRRLMMGKAFFVYFPSLIGSSPQATPMFPDFGEMRLIR